jgi:hypothetical protein
MCAGCGGVYAGIAFDAPVMNLYRQLHAELGGQ